MTAENTVAGFQLSTQQGRIWSQQSVDFAPLPAEFKLLIEGPLDACKLRQSIENLVVRHEILRTVFQRQAGLKMPFQVILEGSSFAWHSLNLSGLDEATQGERLQDLRPRFDLEHGPVVHVVLAELEPERHFLVVNLPALCADRRTMQNLIAEVVRSYGDKQPAADDVLQYADVVAWQEELLTSDESEAGRKFWRDYYRKIDFAAADSLLSRFEVEHGAGAVPDVVRRDAAASLPAPEVLLACWVGFLSRMTGRGAIVVGCEFDGRKYAELENALGVFSKYLPLEFHYDPDAAVGDFSDRVKSATTAAHDWQEAFAWTYPEIPAVLPIGFEDFEAAGPWSAGGANFTLVQQRVCSERFHLKLAVRRRGKETALEFHFDAARLNRGTIEYWADCFATFVTAAGADPGTAIGRLPLLSAEERRRLLVDCNQTAADYPRESCLHGLFEMQAERYPNRPAVRHEISCLSYRELNEKANRLAHRLRHLGVAPDSLVGLCLDRGVEMVVALLGILKAGGAYVPLSADHPKARLQQQLAGAKILVTEQKFVARMPEFGGATLCIDRDQAEWADQPATNPTSQVTPEQLMYVIYTSGSTGTPKGVGVRHRNLVNYASFISRLLKLDHFPEGLHFATVSTLSADLGNTCIFPSLISGGCLHVIDHDVSSDSARLRDSMTRWPVDVLKIVPSHLAALLDAGGGKEVLPRKYLITGGEALTPQLVEKILALDPACEILNHYGPTETTVGSLTLQLKDYDRRNSAAQTIPIGRPIANTQVYILDAQREPVPAGVAGELYIAGDGVTAGYVGQPDLTAERFLPVPFTDGGDKMYRTGDLVRRLPDGSIEFLGRVDDQVKIRGFRIELGEVEAVLAGYEGVRQAIVLAREDKNQDKRLVAYVIGEDIDIDRLRDYARTQLPDYMVPSAFVPMAKVPLNANGKIDRQQLPAPQERTASGKEERAPRTSTEEVVEAIWADVLRRDEIGIDEDFFEIGGHSLLATQIASRLRAQFQIAAPVRMIFEAPTIARMARRVDEERRKEQGLVPPPLTSVPRDRRLPLSFAQERLWVLDSLEPGSPLYNIPRAMRMRGPLNTGALKRALNEIVRRHESQRTTFGVADGSPFQVIASHVEIPLATRDLGGEPEARREEEAQRIAQEESLRPFDLARGPLVRALLLRLADEDHVLLLTMHHIISDAWSAGLFFQELGILYKSFSEGSPSPLPELALQYADYAAHERNWLRGEVLQKKLAYWREQLQGTPLLLDLPADRPRSKARSYRGASCTIALPVEIIKGIRELARQESATVFMTLVTGFQALLSRYSGQQQIVIGTDVANRPTPETERMIGFFINLLPVKTDLTGNPTFRELVRRVRDGLLAGYAHQEVPFARIVEEIQPERSSSHNPIAQVLFVMQNVPRPGRDMAGLQLEPFSIPVGSSKFDLGVFMVEKPEELVGHWVYSTDLFERETILKMARHFAALLRSAILQPDERLSALEILSKEEKEQQEDERRQRKQSQRTRLMAAVSPAIGVPPGEEVEK